MDADAPERTGVRRLVIVGASSADVPAGAVPYATVAATEAGARPAAVADTDPATVIFTSGTTGVAKGCLLPHRALVRAAQCIAEAVELRAEDTVYTAYPLHHMRAAYLDVLPALLVGGRVVIAPRFSASRFWSEIADRRVTVFSLIGTVMQVLWRREQEAGECGHGARITWGGPITVDRDAFHERFGVRVLAGDGVFGMSEIGMLAMSSDDPATNGRVRAIYEVRIADESDEPVAAGDVGEILVRPREPGVIFAGYLNRPDATVAAWRNLWFHTGDLGRIDASGILSFVGRRKDMIRRAGHNISTSEVEEVVLAHEGILECAAVGVPNPLGEEDVAVFVVQRDGATVTPEEIAAHCRLRMAAFMVPAHVVIVGELPKTSTGKVAKDGLHLGLG